MKYLSTTALFIWTSHTRHGFFFEIVWTKIAIPSILLFPEFPCLPPPSPFAGWFQVIFLSPKKYFYILEITSWCFRVEHRAPQLPANLQLGGGGGGGGRGRGGGGGGAQRREDAAKFPFVLSLHFYHPGTAGTDSTFHFCISLNHVKTKSTWFGLVDIIGSWETTCWKVLMHMYIMSFHWLTAWTAGLIPLR